MSQPIVSLKQGTVQGNSTQKAHAFWKVPYAKQPIANLRFKPPQTLDEAPEDFLDASSPPEPSDACIQVGVDKNYNLPDPSLGAFGREDCLTLDVYTASLDSNGTVIDPSDLKAVMLWITGGGGVFGGSYYFAANDKAAPEPTYDMRALVESKDIVGVSINYRLGALGGLGLRALQNEDGSQGSTGNYAHQDVNMALKWVNENIAKFGGDPSRVTIFGQSAGGRMVAWQLVMEESNGLFAAAILESPDTNDAVSVEDQEAMFKTSGIWAGPQSPADQCCNASDDGSDVCSNINTSEFLECLRKLPAESFATLVINGRPTIDSSPIGFSDTILNSFAAGKGSKVPTIFGNNHFESLGGRASNKTDLFAYGLGVVGSLQACADSIQYDVEDDNFGRELITKCSAGPEFKERAAEVLDDETWNEFLALYPRENFETAQERWMLMMSFLAYKAGDHVVTSSLGICHSEILASAYGTFSQLPTYLYFFGELGLVDLVQHSMEFALVLDWEDGEKAARFMPAYNGVDQDTYQQYVNLFVGFWPNFAKSGDPNGDGLPRWLPFSNETQAMLQPELAMSRYLRNLMSNEHDDNWKVLLVGETDNSTELAHMSDGPWFQSHCQLWQDVMSGDGKEVVSAAQSNGRRIILNVLSSLIILVNMFGVS